MLTNGAVETLIANFSDELKAKYIDKMIAGYIQALCLTELCGTDLGLIKTMATKAQDHYILSGNKIWITLRA